LIKTTFICGLCRELLPMNTISELAKDVVTRKPVESFDVLLSKLNISENQCNAVLMTLLQKHDFDFHAVENALFQLVGLLVHCTLWSHSCNSKTTAESSRKMTEVVEIQRQYAALCKLLDSTDTESSGFSALKTDSSVLSKQLSEARLATAAAVHEQWVRHHASSSSDHRVPNDGSLYVDLRGVPSSDARNALQEYILPILPVFGVLIIVCDEQSAGTSGLGVKGMKKGPTMVSTATQSVMAFLSALFYRCEIIANSEGWLKLYCKK
jgi:hypothetical protein